MREIDISDITLNEPRHEELPPDLVARIRAFKEKLGEMDPTSLDETIYNFRCDVHPEREVAIWEEIADRYAEYISAHKDPLQFEVRKEIYRTLVSASCCSVDEKFLQGLEHLSRDEALYLNSFFQNKKPITVSRNTDSEQ